jgi:succinoglycan biosynthesis transport protein ExoP
MMSEDNRLLPAPSVERGLDRPLGDLSATKGYGASQAEPTHLREYLNVVLKRKWLILSLVLVVTTLVAIQMYRMPSIYEAQTTIQIEPKKESILRTGKDQIVINTGRAGTDPIYWQTQLRLLENRALARQVILTLDLQNNPAFLGGQAQTSVVDSLRRILSRDKRPGAEKTAESGIGEIDLVKQGTLTDEKLSAEQLQKFEPYEDTLAANLTVEPVVSTSLVQLRFRHTDPELSKKVVDTLADAFAYNNIDRETATSDKNARLLGERIAELQLKTRQLEEQKFNFAKSNNLPLTTEKGSNIEVERLGQLSSDLLEAENKRKEAESLWKAAGAAVDPNDIPEVQDNKRIQNLREQLDKLTSDRAQMLEIYTEEWPAVKQIDSKIATLRQALAKAPREIVAGMQSRYQSSLSKEASLRAEYNRQRGTTTAQGLAQIQMGTLLQDLETNKQELALLRQRQRELETAGQDRENNVKVSSYSRLPRAPVGPPRARNIMLALLLSLGAGVGLAFLLDYLDDTLKSVDDVDRYLHLPSLALIPASRSDRARLKGRGAAPAEEETTALALASDARSPVAEAYRHLRTSLLLSSAGQPPKTILITSSQPSEGKTTTAVNTAVMLAQTGAEVLIIDCDLRRPRVHANFGLSNGRGVTNYLSGERDLDSLIQPHDKMPNFKILTSGPVPPNPAELLGSTEMRRLLVRLSERFAHIVIDSPPIISFTDASILSTMVDGVMLVVHGGRSSRAVVRRAKQQLIDVGANIFGVVLNNVKLESTDYYYYSGYYSSYYNDGDEEEGPDGASERA